MESPSEETITYKSAISPLKCIAPTSASTSSGYEGNVMEAWLRETNAVACNISIAHAGIESNARVFLIFSISVKVFPFRG